MWRERGTNSEMERDKGAVVARRRGMRGIEGVETKEVWEKGR